jgi:hypothetical protein
LAYLPTWNGISVFYDVKWSSNADLHLWTDASDWGIGAYYNGSWIYEQFQNHSVHLSNKSIAWRELYAIVKAAATWATDLSGKRILIHCDNKAVCDILITGTSKIPDIMVLVRELFFIAARNAFEFSALHVEGVKNAIADALSRGQLETFRSLVPHARNQPDVPAVINMNM